MRTTTPKRGGNEMNLAAPPHTSLLVACHDAGAANLIFAWLRHWLDAGLLKDGDLLLALQGPARDIAQSSGLAALGPSVTLEAIADVRCLISGTGWQSDWEHQARLLAAGQGIRSIAVIDHWVNYLARFIRDGVTCLPQEIWVGDEYAEQIARQTFPALAIQRQPNLYLSSEVAQIPPLPSDGGDVLYLLEPTRTKWGRDSEGEFQALDYFLQHRHLVGSNTEARIRLRLHPSEQKNKYDDWISVNRSHRVCVDDSFSLAEAIGRAAVVVGVQTAAMVVALAAGRQVYSSLPPWAGSFALPHEGIQQLQQLAHHS